MDLFPLLQFVRHCGVFSCQRDGGDGCHLNGLGDDWSARISGDFCLRGCEVVCGYLVIMW